MTGRVLDKLFESDKEMTEFSYRIRFGIVDIFLRVYAHDECLEDKINRLTSHQASSLGVSSLIISVGTLYFLLK